MLLWGVSGLLLYRFFHGKLLSFRFTGMVLRLMKRLVGKHLLFSAGLS